MEELKVKVEEYINGLHADYQQKETELKKDDREDEALMEKIKGNIAEVFLTVFNSSYKQVVAQNGGRDELVEKFSKFFGIFIPTWTASLEDAEDEDDFETVYKEKAKISVAKKIQKQFEKFVGESNV